MVWGTAVSKPSKPKVAYLGPISSYSHQVRRRSVNKIPALSYYDRFDRPTWAFGLTDRVFAQATMGCFYADNFEYVPCIQIKDIFDVVQSGSCERGIIPFENSTNGPVMFTLDLLADRNDSYPDLIVYDETYVDVKHYLLGNIPSVPFASHTTPTHESQTLDSGTCTPTLQDPNPLRPRTKPLTSLAHIKKLYSHPQAFGQCELFLQTYLKGVERIDVSSTSRAAEIAKEDRTGRSAAISSKAASDVHNVNILAEGIEDKSDNRTRFLIIRQKTKQEHLDYPAAATTSSISEGISEEIKGLGIHVAEQGTEEAPPISSTSSTSAMKSLVSFTVDHRSPGALADVLECFRRYSLNLTSINSRPSMKIPFQYIFFVEFSGSRVEGGEESKVESALRDIGKVAREWRWLGSWRDRNES